MEGTREVRTYVVIGRENCRFCTEAMKLLSDEDLDFSYYSLNDPTYKHTLVGLLDDMDLKTVPQVFWGPTYIGGYDSLKAHLKGPVIG
jgi:glutaredoxin